MSKPIDSHSTTPDASYVRLAKEHRHTHIIAPTPCSTPELPPAHEAMREQLTPASSTPRSPVMRGGTQAFETNTFDPFARCSSEAPSCTPEPPDLGTDSIAALLFSEIGKLCGRRPYLSYTIQAMDRAEIAVDVYLDEVTRYHILSSRDMPHNASPRPEDWWYVQRRLVRARSKLRLKDDIQRFQGLLDLEQAKGELDALKRVCTANLRPAKGQKSHSDGTFNMSEIDSPHPLRIQSPHKPVQAAANDDMSGQAPLPRRTITTHVARTAIPINLRLARSREALPKPT